MIILLTPQAPPPVNAALSLPFVQSWLKDAANTFSNVDGPNSTGYAVLSASLLAAGIGYLVLPYPTLVGVFGSSAGNAGPEAVVLWQLIGAGVSMITGPLAYQCKVRAESSVPASLKDSTQQPEDSLMQQCHDDTVHHTLTPHIS